MTSSKQVNIRKNLIQSITNIPCDDFGQTTDLGVFSAYLYTPESCDGLQRHDHVMLPKGVLITVETPVSKRVSLNHPYRFNTITLRFRHAPPGMSDICIGSRCGLLLCVH